MRYPRFSWSICASLLIALAVSGCGDTSVDLDDQPDFNDSALRLSQPANELMLLWDAVEDVTQYRVLQTDDGPELIPGKAVVVDKTNLTIDVSAFGPFELGAAKFEVESKDPDEDVWTDVTFIQRGQLAPREVQFDWDPVDGASQYRLTQTAGRYALLPLPQQQVIYPSDKIYDRFVVPLHLFDWVNSRFTLEAQVAGDWVFVGEQDTADVKTELLIDRYSEIDPFATQLAFGWSIALSENGGTMAVGAIGETSVPVDQRECPEDKPDCDKEDLLVVARNAGGVYTYTPLSADEEIVKAPNTGIEDLFGRRVVLSDDGTTLAVSALTEDSGQTGIHPAPFNPLADNEDAENSGAVYVYVRSNDAWELQAYIKAPNAEEGDLFGWDIALSGDGNTLAVSAVSEDSGGSDPQDNSVESVGAVYVYTRTDSIWTQQAYLKASNADVNDSFGSALATSQNGDYLAIAALGESGSPGQPASNARLGSGAVYVFVRDIDDAWSQVSYLKASNAGENDLFGQALSFDADATLLAVGAPQEDRLNSNIVSVDSGVESLNTGAVYLFTRSGEGINSTFAQESFYFKPSNGSQNQQFGQAVSLSSSGDTLAVGAWGERSIAVGIGGNQDGETAPAAGAVYVFNRTSGSNSWEQVNYVKASNQQSNLYFGAKLALAEDGRLLAVAGNGVRPDSIITPFSGFVYLY